MVVELKPIPVVDEAAEWPAECGSCGIATADDFDPIYMTIYLPQQEPKELILANCGSCSASSWPTLTEGGEPLVDKQANGRSSGGPEAPRQAQAFPDVQWTL